MANGHVEIHDPFSNRSDLTAGSDSEPRSTSDMDDTVEFRLLMAYAKRRRPTRGAESPPEKRGLRSPQTSATTEKEEEEEEGKIQKKKKKKGGIRLSKLLSCIKPRIKEDEPPRSFANTPRTDERCLCKDEGPEEDEALAEVASQLTEIVDEIPFTPPEIPFTPPEIESDSPTKEEDAVEKMIGLLLRDYGDRLNEQALKDANITAELLSKYSFFEKLVKAFLIKMGLLNPQPDALGPHASNKTQIAMTCEVTSRLAAANTLPMNRMLYHGARYLQDHYSSWAQQHGGYEEAFYSDNEDEDDKDEDKKDDVQ